MLGAVNQGRLGSLSGQLQPIRQMMQMVRSAGNPQAMIGQLMQSNPAVAQAMRLVQDSGGDARTAFYRLAEQSGIDPEQILGMLK